jgi:hypothetical protein
MIRSLALLVVFALSCSTASPRLVNDGSFVSLALLNRTSERVCYLSLSPPNDEAWSDDLLGSATIAPGATQAVRLPPGEWHLRTENCQHEVTGIVRNARITRSTTLVLQ